MITRGIRRYVARDWAAARAAKDAYWADRIARLGAVEGLRIAGELLEQARLQHPDWPSAADRQEDVNSHVRLAERLRRACPTRRP